MIKLNENSKVVAVTFHVEEMTRSKYEKISGVDFEKTIFEWSSKGKGDFMAAITSEVMKLARNVPEGIAIIQVK